MLPWVWQGGCHPSPPLYCHAVSGLVRKLAHRLHYIRRSNTGVVMQTCIPHFHALDKKDIHRLHFLHSQLFLANVTPLLAPHVKRREGQCHVTRSMFIYKSGKIKPFYHPCETFLHLRLFMLLHWIAIYFSGLVYSADITANYREQLQVWSPIKCCRMSFPMNADNKKLPR